MWSAAASPCNVQLHLLGCQKLVQPRMACSQTTARPPCSCLAPHLLHCEGHASCLGSSILPRWTLLRTSRTAIHRALSALGRGLCHAGG